jgi:predicted transposase YdaD
MGSVRSFKRNMPIAEVVNLNTASEQFSPENNGLSQDTECNEKITKDMRVRRMINMWTEGMSPLEQVRMEGREEGRNEAINEGREESRQEFVEQALQQGLLADVISDITKLPIEKIKEIKSLMEAIDSDTPN